MMRIVAIVLAVLAIGCTGCRTSSLLKQPIPASSPIGLHDEHTDRIGEAVRKTMRQEKIPGISVAVIDHGKIWAQGFGWRDTARRLPVDTDTQFQAGSISKPVTALAVLLLEASGRVDLDRDVNAYLKDWQLHSKFTNNPVTLRELLCHRAGMVPHGFVGVREGSRVPSITEVLDGHHWLLSVFSGNYFGTIKVAYPPGSVYRYSGGGYCVVQKAVEDVTGQSFETAMGELVLEPLQMSRSNFQQPPQDTNNIACGYNWQKTILGGGRWRVFPEKAMGGLWSTPQDLARFISAVQRAESNDTNGPISPAVVRKYLATPYDGWQGIGIRLSSPGKQAFYHAGENPGYYAYFSAGVSDGRALVIMSNAQKNRFGLITKAIVREFNWN